MPIVPMTEKDIVLTLAGRGYMIEPGALRLLKGRADLSTVFSTTWTPRRSW